MTVEKASNSILAQIKKHGGIKSAALPSQPMLATKTAKAFNSDEWIFEVKWDGYRIIAQKKKKDVNLLTRKAQNYTTIYSTITAELIGLPFSVVLDGEVIFLDEEGKPSFDDLQKVQQLGSDRLLYCVFDILWFEGYSLLKVPLIERKRILRHVLPNGKHVVQWEFEETNGIELFDQMKEKGMEGIVAKRKKSIYQPGKRVDDWLKITTHTRQEFVIGGWTESESGRPFRSLLFGYYDNGKLICYGHAGGGYTDKNAIILKNKLLKIETTKNPFSNKVETDTKPHWVKPILVGEFQYATTTKSGKIRKPAIFKGLRTDKQAKEVYLETKEPATFKKDSATKEKVIANQHQISTKADKPVASKNTESNWPELKAALSKGSTNTLEVEGQNLKLNNLEKKLWSDHQITKAKLIQYYIEMADYILPYLKDRPLSLHLKHLAIGAPGMYIKGMEGNQPAWADVFKTKRKHKKANRPDVIDYLVCNNTATLVYLINLGCIDVNPWNSRVQSPLNPDYIVIDLDPSVDNFNAVIESARVTKNVLDKLKLQAFVKTSGKTGMHIFIPVESVFTYPQARLFASRICELVHKQIPDITTIEDTVSLRGGKVFLDDNQNDEADTVACVYSVRPYHIPTVSTPLEWKEVKRGLDPSVFTINNTVKRLEHKGDLFADLLSKKIRLANTARINSFFTK
jgi:bifunctional non-homologous end joining protein LigD